MLAVLIGNELRSLALLHIWGGGAGRPLRQHSYLLSLGESGACVAMVTREVKGMELLTGLALGWQQPLYSVKMPQTKGCAPRLPGVMARLSSWGVQPLLSRGQEWDSLQGPFFLCLAASLSPPSLLPQDREKDREEMSGRCQIGWAEGTGDQAETGNRGKTKVPTWGASAEEPPAPSSSSEDSRHLGPVGDQGLLYPFSDLSHLKPGGNQSEVYCPHFTAEQAETRRGDEPSPGSVSELG